MSSTLSEPERTCVRRYVELLAERLGGGLIRVELIGSAARGELWPAHHPIHSDIDLLVVTIDAVVPSEADALVNETYPLFLECGRQISPQFLDQARVERPATERDAAFVAAVRPDAIELWPQTRRRGDDRLTREIAWPAP